MSFGKFTATIDWNKPIQTRSGDPARLLGILKADVFGYVVAVDRPKYGEVCFFVDSNGRIGDQSLPQIVNVPEKKVRAKLYVNLYARTTWSHHNQSAAYRSAGDEAIIAGQYFYSEMTADEAKMNGFEYEEIA